MLPSVFAIGTTVLRGLAHKFGDQGAVGFGRQNQLPDGLVDGQVGGKVAKAALCLSRGYADFLFGRGYDARSLFLDGGLDARLVLQALFLHLGTDFCDLFVEPG